AWCIGSQSTLLVVVFTGRFLSICLICSCLFFFFFFQAEDGIRDWSVTGFRRVLFRSSALAFLFPSPAQRKAKALRPVRDGVPDRSEERRVGKEGRSRRDADGCIE